MVVGGKGWECDWKEDLIVSGKFRDYHSSNGVIVEVTAGKDRDGRFVCVH